MQPTSAHRKVVRYQTPPGEREKRFETLAADPKGIDPNEFYAKYLIQTDHADQAGPYLERALNAPSRPGRQIADSGRREEVRALMNELKPHRAAAARARGLR